LSDQMKDRTAYKDLMLMVSNSENVWTCFRVKNRDASLFFFSSLDRPDSH
jgi:hypothetical protein